MAKQKSKITIQEAFATIEVNFLQVCEFWRSDKAIINHIAKTAPHLAERAAQVSKGLEKVEAIIDGAHPQLLEALEETSKVFNIVEFQEAWSTRTDKALAELEALGSVVGELLKDYALDGAADTDPKTPERDLAIGSALDKMATVWSVGQAETAEIRARIEALRAKYPKLFDPEKKKTRKKSGQPDSPSGLTPAQLSAIVRAPDFNGDRVIHRGLMRTHIKSEWNTNEHEGYKAFSDREGIMLYQPKEILPEGWLDTAKTETLAALESRLMQIKSELTADVIDILFHHWRTTPAKDKDKALITLAQICHYRGVQADQTENLRDAWEAMQDIQGIQLIGKEEARQALFEIASKPLSAIDVAYVYSPGYFLSKEISDNPVYLAPYLQSVWTLRPHFNGKAKRLARYLRSEWRRNVEDYLRRIPAPPVRYRAWKSVLEDAGITPEDWEQKKPARFIKGINEALAKLHELRIIADYGPEIYHPEDRPFLEKILNKTQRTNVLQTFLALRVCIDPDADIADALEPYLKKRLAAAQAKALTASKEPRKKTGKAKKSPY